MIKMFNHWFSLRSITGALLDSSFLILSLVIVLMWIGNGLPVNLKQVIVFSSVFAVVMLGINLLLGFYQRTTTRPYKDNRARSVLSLYLAIPVAYLLYGLLPITTLNRDLIQLSAMSALFGMLVTRIGAAQSTTNKILRRRILVFGTGVQAIAVKQALERSDPSAEIIGFYLGVNEDQPQVSPSMVLGRELSLTDTARNLEADEIVVAVSERRGGSMPLRELLDCKLQGIKVLDLASHFEQTLGQIRLDSLYAGWLIFGDGFRQGVIRTTVKRIFDIVCACILIILALPLIFLASVFIILEDGFPLLYRQERVGLNGRLFNVIKFRSMRRDAEKDGKPVWAMAKDNRVTRVGQIIRKLRIDELPQLFSVLKGDMSLVGPRPERPFFVDQLTKEIPFYAVRHSVKPGVTGWAQVRYHYGATVEDSAEKLQYDLYYVKNHSLFLDLVVLFETVGVVLTGKGAH